MNVLVREADVGRTGQANFRLGSLVAAMFTNLAPLLCRIIFVGRARIGGNGTSGCKNDADGVD